MGLFCCRHKNKRTERISDESLTSFGHIAWVQDWVCQDCDVKGTSVRRVFISRGTEEVLRTLLVKAEQAAVENYKTKENDRRASDEWCKAYAASVKALKRRKK